jgi:hypothetical protein
MHKCDLIDSSSHLEYCVTCGHIRGSHYYVERKDYHHCLMSKCKQFEQD